MQVDPSESTPCAACGDPFVCGAGRFRVLGERGGERPGASCWCGGARLGDAARARAARTYRGCLCPACLRLLADGRLPGEGAGGEGEPVAQSASASSAPEAVAETTSSCPRRCRT